MPSPPPARRRKPAPAPAPAPAAAADTSPPLGYMLACAVLIGGYVFAALSTPSDGPAGAAQVVVLDAGSTGTRAQIFSFDEGRALVKTEMFSDGARVAALGFGGGGGGPAFFKPLLDRVKLAVASPRRRARTPVVLRATGGVRALGDEAVLLALAECRKALRGSGFLFRDEWVGVMGEVDEAVKAWETVNWLLGGESVGVMDLGGSSLEIALESDARPGAPERLSDAQLRAGVPQPVAASVREGRLRGERRRIVAKSHAGGGVADFMKRLYWTFEREGVLAYGNPCFRRGREIKGKTIRFGLPGQEESTTVDVVGDGDFDRCVASVDIAAAAFDVPSKSIVAVARDTEFVAFAYFYDRTVGYGLPERPTKAQLVAKGESLCERPVSADGAATAAEAADESCAEFAYVYKLLRDMSNDFDPETGVTFRFTQYVDGHMLGWALGEAAGEPFDVAMAALPKKV